MDPMIIAILVVGLALLLFMNWRAKKRQQEQLSFRDTLEEGQQVQTIGGLIGTVTEVEADRVTLESTPGTEMVFLKVALARVIEPVEFDAEESDESEESEFADESADVEQAQAQISSPDAEGDEQAR